MFKSLIIITFFLNILTQVFSLKCWDCNSIINAACSDPFLNAPFSSTECPEPEDGYRAVCRKTFYKYEEKINVRRNCGIEKNTTKYEKCENVKNKNSYEELECICFTMGCNGSTLIHLSPIVLLSFISRFFF